MTNMFSFRYLATIVVGFFLSSALVAADDGCVVQTIEVNSDPDMTSAVRKLNEAVAEQVLTCAMNNQTSCDVDVTQEQQDKETTCTDVGGQNYQPAVTVSCDNDNTGITTTLIWQYSSCIGANCTTDDFESNANELLQNRTNQINVVLNRQGVNCESSLSGTVVTAAGGAFLAAIVTVGVMALISL